MPVEIWYLNGITFHLHSDTNGLLLQTQNRFFCQCYKPSKFTKKLMPRNKVEQTGIGQNIFCFLITQLEIPMSKTIIQVLAYAMNKSRIARLTASQTHQSSGTTITVPVAT